MLLRSMRSNMMRACMHHEVATVSVGKLENAGSNRRRGGCILQGRERPGEQDAPRRQDKAGSAGKAVGLGTAKAWDGEAIGRSTSKAARHYRREDRPLRCGPAAAGSTRPPARATPAARPPRAPCARFIEASTRTRNEYGPGEQPSQTGPKPSRHSTRHKGSSRKLNAARTGEPDRGKISTTHERGVDATEGDKENGAHRYMR